MVNHELSKREWLDKAEAYCARAEHCAADVRRKLYEWGAPEDFSDGIVENLYKNEFLNDARFCAAYVHDKVEYQSWGRIKIQAGLRALNLPEDEIQKSLDEIDEKQYKKNLEALIKQRKSDPEEKRARFLLQRGYTYEEIKQFFNNLY